MNQERLQNRSLSESTGNKDRGRVPRWRLAREGPFPNERSQASLRVLGKGCAFRHTTYNVEDHAPPEGGLGVPLNHPRFLEWIGAPESAWLLEMSPGQWCDTLSRDQAMTAAMQLHRDACLPIVWNRWVFVVSNHMSKIQFKKIIKLACINKYLSHVICNYSRCPDCYPSTSSTAN